MIKGELKDTGRQKLGVIMGDNCKTGIHASLYPGIKINPGCMTLPGEIVKRDLICNKKAMKIILDFDDTIFNTNQMVQEFVKNTITIKFFIDDKAEQIDKVKNILQQIIAIKMERPQGEHINAKSNLANCVVKNLDEAKKIINELNK